MHLVSMVAYKFAVIGDVHSNSLALKAAFDSIAKYESVSGPLDCIVFIGDLMTYGVRPMETLHELIRFSSNKHVKLILGNHDICTSIFSIILALNITILCLIGLRSLLTLL